MSLPTGAGLGPYETLAAIGAGGMGEVYRAGDTRLGRHVAIKVLSCVTAPDAASPARAGRQRPASAIRLMAASACSRPSREPLLALSLMRPPSRPVRPSDRAMFNTTR